MFCNGARIALRHALEQPFFGRGRIRKGLLRSKRFGCNEKQRSFRAAEFQCLYQMRAVNIRHEMHLQSCTAIVKLSSIGLERFRHHHRPQIGASNTNIDDIGNGFARIALPRATAHSLGEFSHVGQIGVHFGHYIFAIHNNRPVGAIAQGDMQYGPVFRDVDLFAVEHFLRPAGNIGLRSKRQQQRQRLFSDTILGKIQ